VINITGNFLNRILELFSTVDTVSAPSVSGILKLVILSTIDNLDQRMLRRVKLVGKYLPYQFDPTRPQTMLFFQSSVEV
jgi:hypothetical protein